MGIACQKSIPRFLLISVKYLCLSTFPKVADLIGAQSLIASHFLWQVCQTGKCTLGSNRNQPPLPSSWIADVEREELPKPEPSSRVQTQKQDHLCGQRNRRGHLPFPVSGAVRHLSWVNRAP